MFVIQWVYAVANIGVALLLFLYIGKTNPGLPPGEFPLHLAAKPAVYGCLALLFEVQGVKKCRIVVCFPKQH